MSQLSGDICSRAGQGRLPPGAQENHAGTVLLSLAQQDDPPLLMAQLR